MAEQENQRRGQPEISPVSSPSSPAIPQGQTNPGAAPIPAPAPAIPSGYVPYQPYQPYPMYPQAAYPRRSPSSIEYAKKGSWVKVGLTVASLVFAIILLSLSVTVSEAIDFGATLWWCLPLEVAVILWDVAELITMFACARRRNSLDGVRRGIHPGAHVGVDLILWLAAAFCTFVSVVAYLDVQSTISDCQEESDDGNDGSLSFYYSDDYCDDAALGNTYLPMIRAVMAFLGLLTLVHFVIFVYACHETNQYNRNRATFMMAPPPMYYAPPPPPGMMPYPNAYPMMPQQAHMGGPIPQGPMVAGNEKGLAVQPVPQPVPQPDPHASLAGFYAPPPSAAMPGPARAGANGSS